MRCFLIEGFLLYPPAPLLQAAILDGMKTVARNGMEGGYTGRQVIIYACLTEPQGKLKIHFLTHLTNTEKNRY